MKTLNFVNSERLYRIIDVISSGSPSTQEQGDKIDISCSDRSVIRADVNRSVCHWDIHQHMKTSQRIRRKKALLTTLEVIIGSSHRYKYYQGFHEVCLLMLEVTKYKVPQAILFLKALCSRGFEPFLQNEFEVELYPILEEIKNIISIENPEVASLIGSYSSGYHFVIPWILTWFAHNLESFKKVCRVFECLVNRESGIGVQHLCAAFLLEDHDKLENRLSQGSSDSIHKLVNDVRLEIAIERAAKLARRYPGLASPLGFPNRRTVGLIRRYLMVLAVFAVLVAVLWLENAVSPIKPS
jgi:hypothetical protein